MQIWQTSRIRLFDTLKGLCILFVIISHYSWSDGLMALLPFWVDVAVPVFMIISGYVLSGSFEKHGVLRLEDAYGLGTVLPKLIRYTVPFFAAYLIELCDLIIKGALSRCFRVCLPVPARRLWARWLLLSGAAPACVCVPGHLLCHQKSAQRGIAVVFPCECGI